MEQLLKDFEKHAAPWLGLMIELDDTGERMKVAWGTGQYDRTWPEPDEYIEWAELRPPDDDFDHKNAQARDLILDALEAKGLETFVSGISCESKRPAGRYQCDLETFFMETFIQEWGATRTEAVLRASIAAARAAKEGGS